MKLRERLYADTIINPGRQHELDLQKAMVIYITAMVHCVIECTPEEMLVSGIPYLFDTVIGGPLGAPIYMFAMGVGIVYSRDQSIRGCAVNGIRIFIIGFVLNICRFLIPYLIGFGISGDREKYIEPLVYKVMGNDILQFAGLALLIIAFLRKYRVKDWQMLLIAAAASLLGTALIGVDVENPAGNIALGYLIGTEDEAGMVASYFPVLNWLIFPVCGYAFGNKLKYVKNKNLFYGIISGVCVPTAVIYFAYGITYERGMFGEGQNCYYHMLFSDAFASMMSTLGLLGLYYFITKILPSWMIKLSGNVSKNLNSIYCIHWIFVIYSTNIILYLSTGSQFLPVWQSILLGAVITVISIVLANIWTRIKKQMRGRKNHEKA